MANSSAILGYASASPVTNAGVAASAAVPDNCHTIIIENTGANTLLIGQGSVGTALTAGTNAFSLATGLTLTLAIGTLSTRGSMAGTAQLIYGCSGGVTTATILYVCAFGQN